MNRGSTICTQALREAKGDDQAIAIYGNAAAYCHWGKDDYRGALIAADQALTSAIAIGDNTREAQLLTLIIAILYDIGDLGSADAALRHAQRAARKPGADPTTVLFYRGLLRAARGELKSGEVAYRRFLRDAPATHASRRAAHLNLVELLVQQDKLQQAKLALTAANAALPADERSDGNLPVAHLLFRAEIAQAAGHAGLALKDLDEALRHNPSEDWRQQLLSNRGFVLESLGRTQDAIRAFVSAIQVVESQRKRLGNGELKYWLLKKRRTPYEGLFSLHANQGNILAALTTAEKAKARAFLDAFITAQQTNATKTLDVEAAAARADLARQLIPQLSAAPTALAQPIADTLRRLQGRSTVLYFVARDELWLFSKHNGHQQLIKIARNVEHIKALLEEFLVDPERRDIRRELGALLLPKTALPPAGKDLMVVPDPLLADLPFAALEVDGRPLIARHAIRYSPSLSAWSTLLKRERSTPTTEAIILGDPLGDLLAAREEARAVARRLGVQATTGKAATMAALRNAHAVNILHITSHSGVDQRGAWLQLADGRVGADKVLAWKLAPRIVVLASCTSAQGHGPGLFGSLAGAFLAAGSENVLASLWSIDDKAAARFVQRFYIARGDRRPAQALAEAQLASIAAGDPVALWSSFVLFGDRPRPLDIAQPIPAQPIGDKE